MLLKEPEVKPYLNLLSMNNSTFSKIIDALQIQLFKVNLRKVVQPVQLDGSYEQKNVLIQARKGSIYVGSNYVQLPEGGFYFVPAGQPIFVKFGRSAKYYAFGKESFPSSEEREKFIKPISALGDVSNMEDTFAIVRFDVSIYNVISLFSLLETPGLIIPRNEALSDIITKILEEEEQSNIGKSKMLETLGEQMLIHVFRFIEAQPDFGKYMETLNYLLDKRLINIIKYIQDNLDKDLSNKAIASVAYVSEDYVGQFFKSLTNKNLQEYVENQRLERAHYLLRTRSDIVQEIAYQVGFKDPAYFSRRFKLKYGVNANVVRRKDSITL
jgi:AraC family transcriptional regulator, arabinose operon regulatory protein